MLLLLFVRYRRLILKLKHEELNDKKRLICQNQTSRQHRLRNKLNMEFVTCDK